MGIILFCSIYTLTYLSCLCLYSVIRENYYIEKKDDNIKDFV